MAETTIKASEHFSDVLDAAGCASAWLNSWAKHVGSCAGDKRCTCGLTAVRSELEYAIVKYHLDEDEDAR